MTRIHITPPRRMSLGIALCLMLLALFGKNCPAGQWTMMFYMAADNDLYSQALTDIEELRQISGQPGVDILVQLDCPSGAFRYRVLPRGVVTLASLGKSNSGSPEALADFGNWTVKNFPAQKYLLVLWDHGDGWSKRDKSIGIDGLDYLSVAGGELREALANICATAGQPLDAVIFDACSMQMAEVLLELNGFCRYAVGSEALFPVEGMPYDAAWRDVNGDVSAESLAVKLVNSCGIYGSLGYQVTCSAVDIGALSLAAQNLRSITGRLRQLPVSAYVDPAALSDSVLNFPPFSSYDLPRALDFLGSRIPDPEKTSVLDVSRQFRNSVLANSVTGSQYQAAQGLAVWYPEGRMNFESGIESYQNLKWCGLSGWDKLLYQLIIGPDSAAPVPQNVSLVKSSGGLEKLSWENGYDPSGIEYCQIRHSQGLITVFDDRGGSSDSSNWHKTGFVTVPQSGGDTAYYSIGGRMTGKNSILFDSSGNIGFYAKGVWGTIVLESSGDTVAGWDTLGAWNRFGDSTERYYSAKVKDLTVWIRFSWNPFSGGYWACLDDIKVCHPDPAMEVKMFRTSQPFYDLVGLPGVAGFYQVRSVDSLGNTSSWSDARYCQPAAGSIRVLPNPFKGKVFLFHSSSTERMQEVKIYNILGQYMDRMTPDKREISGGTEETLYYWEPKASMANGLYIALLKSDQGVRAVKLILIR